ncbi:MAG: 6-pyruvoyl tetrahydropterin synthase family protein [Planctomycetaceae bacterium]|nr:6-pyruvoyl tetrahydropterin synthase family protein [Planctomycetaceae bacterium]
MSSPREEYRVRVTKDHLVFSAAHFITIGRDLCERLHGHNWRVAVEVVGSLDENEYVFDFIALRDAAQKIVDELDHRMLLPEKHPQIQLNISEREIEATYDDRRWIFPREECIILPIVQTTAERIAEWFARRLYEIIKPAGADQLDSIQVDVEENFGQWASYKMTVGKLGEGA